MTIGSEISVQKAADRAASMASLRRELRQAKAAIAMLRAELRVVGAPAPQIPTWAESMTPQELALVTALKRAWPRTVTNDVIDDLLPHFDHAAERCSTLVAVVVSRARRKLPPGAIERVRGLGYRLSDQAREALAAD